MADQSDVEIGLKTIVDAVLYPTGQSGNPPLTIAGAPCRIERGWPDQTRLDADLRAGIFNVTIYPRPNMERNTSRYQSSEQVISINPTTYTLTGAGQTVTVGGAAPGAFYAQNICVVVNQWPYIVAASPGETAAQVAAALQALISVDFPAASVVGAVITLPAGARIGALSVGATGLVLSEVGRQEKQFQICFWCPSPDLRDLAVKSVDAALRSYQFITLADGSRGRLTYHGTNSFDGPQKELLYRRDLFYSVEWATTLASTAVQILSFGYTLRDADGNIIVSIPRAPVAVGAGGILDFSDPNNSGLLGL